MSMPSYTLLVVSRRLLALPATVSIFLALFWPDGNLPALLGSLLLGAAGLLQALQGLLSLRWAEEHLRLDRAALCRCALFGAYGFLLLTGGVLHACSFAALLAGPLACLTVTAWLLCGTLALLWFRTTVLDVLCLVAHHERVACDLPCPLPRPTERRGLVGRALVAGIPRHPWCCKGVCRDGVL